MSVKEKIEPSQATRELVTLFLNFDKEGFNDYYSWHRERYYNLPPKTSGGEVMLKNHSFEFHTWSDIGLEEINNLLDKYQISRKHLSDIWLLRNALYLDFINSFYRERTKNILFKPKYADLKQIDEELFPMIAYVMGKSEEELRKGAYRAQLDFPNLQSITIKTKGSIGYTVKLTRGLASRMISELLSAIQSYYTANEQHYRPVSNKDETITMIRNGVKLVFNVLCLEGILGATVLSSPTSQQLRFINDLFLLSDINLQEQAKGSEIEDYLRIQFYRSKR